VGARAELEPLPDEASAVLVDERAPGLAAPLRARVPAEAAGNPLALTELAVAAPASAREACGRSRCR
jgi:hypothetical protein